MNRRASLLLVGESDTGKTHYGAQLLGRLSRQDSALRLTGAPDSIAPFKAALGRISLGLSADHTPERTYEESIWPIVHQGGGAATIIWPDYGGEQIKRLIETRRMPTAWRSRITESTGWIVLARPSRMPLPEDALTRSAALPARADEAPVRLSPQSRFVELLQMLQFVASAAADHRQALPPIAILLSCYDELESEQTPVEYLVEHLPLIDQYVSCHWPTEDRRIFALSALGQALSKDEPDSRFALEGPENFGFVVDEAGKRSTDLTLPLQWLIQHASRR
jgi:hypothetical protein